MTLQYQLIEIIWEARQNFVGKRSPLGCSVTPTPCSKLLPRAVAKGRVLARPTLCRLDGHCSEQVGAASRGWAWFSVQGGSMASTSDELTDFLGKPHQPRSFAFLKRSFGTSKVVERSFQQNWFDKVVVLAL